MSDEPPPSFGFADKSPDKESKPEFKYSDTLRCRWSELEVGRRVQSTLTSVLGTITQIDSKRRTLEIDWDNGNNSNAKKEQLGTVTVYDVKQEKND